MCSINYPETSSQSVEISSQSDELNELLVENLDDCGWAIEDYTNFLRGFFDANFGPVHHLDIATYYGNRLSKGYGFVTFKNSSDAQKVLNASEEQLTIVRKYREPRILKVSPTRNSLRSRVRSFVQDRDKQMKQCEDFVSKLISGEVKREPLAEKRDSDFVEMNSLPDETIEIIFENLKQHQNDLASCRLVCKRWSTIIQNIEKSEHSITLHQPRHRDTDFNERVFTILKKYPKLRELDLRLPDFTVDELTTEIIGQCCPNLEKLCVKADTIVPLKDFAEHYPGLKIMVISGCRYLEEKDLCEFLKIAQNLQDLSLWGLHSITGECFHHLSKLEKLSISDCLKIRDESMTELANSCKFSLKELKIWPISRNALSIVWKSFPNLLTLRLWEIDPGTLSEVFKNSPSFEKLESLHIESRNILRYSRSPERSDLNDEDFINFISSCRNLKELRFRQHDWLSDDGVSRIPDFCVNLRILDISCSQISDWSLDFLSNLKLLERLSLGGTDVTDEGVKKILTSCPNLKSLAVRGCREVTIETLLTALHLKEAGLLDQQLIISYGRKWVSIKSLSSRKDIYDIENELECETEDEYEMHDYFDDYDYEMDNYHEDYEYEDEEYEGMFF